MKRCPAGDFGGNFLVIYGTDGLNSRAQARDLLALAATQHWGISPLPEILPRAGGKPYFPKHPNWEFNLSHSGPLALCALSDAPVGVDIQVIKSWRPNLPNRVCSPRELAWLEVQNDFWRAFTALWVCKESRVKYTGEGLTTPIRSISIPLPKSEESLYQLDGLWFRLYSGSGWLGAVCALSPPPQTIHWVPSPLPAGSAEIPL